MSEAMRFENPDDPLNGPKYHSGKPCYTKGCTNPSGTAWSPFWCQSCNADRMKRIGNFLETETARYEGQAK